MNIKILSQNIANNPNDYTSEEIEEYFEDYGNILKQTHDKEVAELKAEIERYQNYCNDLPV